MTKKEKIIEIIDAHGDNLSDVFTYYCNDVQAELKSIAEEILEALGIKEED